MNNNTVHELNHRHNDGIDVTMLWNSETNGVTVVVDDAKGGQTFAIEVRPDERAMDVFHHPFAYAANRANRYSPQLAEAA